jgi:hypothetical protein
MRLRILFGSLFLLAGLALYAFLVATIARQYLPEHWAVEILFYAVTGIIWIWPAALLTRWMQQAAPYHPPPGASQ